MTRPSLEPRDGPRFRVVRPILPEGARAGDIIIPGLQDGCIWLVRKLPAAYGRWLGYFNDGAAEAVTLAPEESAAWLAQRMPSPPRPIRRRVFRRGELHVVRGEGPAQPRGAA